MAPTLFIVPGLWEGPGAFQPLVEELRESGHAKTFTATLVSTGHHSLSGSSPSMDDDTAAVAADLARIVEEAGDDGVVALLHSAGGFLGSGAMRGLTAAARQKENRNGGVQKIIFLCAAAVPEGFEHQPLPFFDIDVSCQLSHGTRILTRPQEDKGTNMCKDPLNGLFNDLPLQLAKEWNSKMEIQPARGWDGTVTYCGWREVPSVYILAERDALLPVQLQTHFAETAGSKIVKIDGGHMVQLSRTKELAGIVGQVLDGGL